MNAGKIESRSLVIEMSWKLLGLLCVEEPGNEPQSSVLTYADALGCLQTQCLPKNNSQHSSIEEIIIAMHNTEVHSCKWNSLPASFCHIKHARHTQDIDTQ